MVFIVPPSRGFVKYIIPRRSYAALCRAGRRGERARRGAFAGALYDPLVNAPLPRTERPSESFSVRFEELATATPRRRRDVVLRTLDVIFATTFLLVSLPLSLPLA